VNVVIVGNGKTILDHKYGELIDSCDVVIRMGRFILDGYEKHVGTKTDVYSAKWISWWTLKTLTLSPSPRIIDVDNLSEIWFQFCDPHTTKNLEICTPFEQTYLNFWAINSFKHSNLLKNMSLSEHHQRIHEFRILNKEIIHYSNENILECIRLLNFEKNKILTCSGGYLVEPTTSLMTIQMAIQRFPDAKIYIVGFDNFSNDHYWNSKNSESSKYPYIYEKRIIKNWISSKKISKLEKLYIKKWAK
jgi:hypothetical protein